MSADLTALIVQELNTNWHKMAAEAIEQGTDTCKRTVDSQVITYAFDREAIVFLWCQPQGGDRFGLVLTAGGYRAVGALVAH